MTFKNFPHIAYTLPDGDTKILKDIMVRVYYKSGFDDEKSIYNFYDIGDGERPEDVSYKVYGSQEYHWVILLFNEILDPYNDWYMSQSNLLKYVKSKYTNMTDVHHYVDGDGYVNYEAVGTPVTNYDHELTLNEDKRQIKLLSGEYLKIFVDAYNDTLYNG